MPWTETDLHKAWKRIRRDFFPAWGGGRHWTVVYHPRSNGNVQGLCDERGYIHVFASQLLYDCTGRDAMLIHEACHAVTGCDGHGERWRRRMFQAAGRAHWLKQEGLAEELEKQIIRYMRRQVEQCHQST